MDLEETDRLVACSYCGVKNFLYSPGLFRFVMGHKAPGKEIVYVPYLRFKGSVFSCHMEGVRHRIVDFSRQGTPFKHFPFSLGLRPQTLKMKFAGPDIKGRFLKCSLTSSDVLAAVDRQAHEKGDDPVFHRALIGEAISLIYLPLYVEKEVLFDGVTNSQIVQVPEKEVLLSTLAEERFRRGSFSFFPPCVRNAVGIWREKGTASPWSVKTAKRYGKPSGGDWNV